MTDGTPAAPPDSGPDGNRWLREYCGIPLSGLPRSPLSVVVPEDRALVLEQMTKRMRGEIISNDLLDLAELIGAAVEGGSSAASSAWARAAASVSACRS